MKKFFIGFVALLTVGTMVRAGELEDNCGCGLGSMLFQGKSGLVHQVLAATTNGSFGNQTFGISSGTLNCKQPATMVSNKQLNQFVAENLDNLASEIAIGSGESVEALAELLAIPEAKRVAFYNRLQEHFEDIFTANGVTAHDVVVRVVKLARG